MAKWLSEAIPFVPAKFTLITNSKDFQKFQTKIGVKPENRMGFLVGDLLAATYFFHKADDPGVVVAMGIRKGRSLNTYHAVLAHEAVHVWQDILEQVSETNPGDEISAYAIQYICQELFSEMDKKLKR